MKKIFNVLFITILPLFMGSCENFFITDPDDTIASDDYITAQNEIYTGYYGILTKMQEMADHAIYLTDTRGNYIKTTINAPQELQEIYNYAPTDGNTYADPSCYYSLIIACNDYLHKMAEYKLKVGGALDTAEEDWKALISSAIRVKAWTYLRLAQIYGIAYWFNDPMLVMKDLSDINIFTKLSTPTDIADRCLSLLDNGEDIKGIEGINGSLTMDWPTYLNPEDPNASTYVQWKYVTPDWLLLRSEILLWTANPDYAWIRDNILTYLKTIFDKEGRRYRLNVASAYAKYFSDNNYNSENSVCLVAYNYKQNQINRLASHFSASAPNNYYLCPSTYGYSLYTENDIRRNINGWVSGDTLMGKYMTASSARQKYESDASVPLQRGHDYHFFLSEAENALGNWDQAETILNNGTNGRFSTSAAIEADTTWDNRYSSWNRYNTNFNMGLSGFSGSNNHSYGLAVNDNRIVMMAPKAGVGARDTLSVTAQKASIRLKAEAAEAYCIENNVDYTIDKDGKIILPNEAARQKYFDLQLLDEMILEYVGEGRSYGMLIRMALKYNDPSIIANRVCPKYPLGMQEDIRAKILAGEYFVKWSL